ncbi:MAG: BON domain-containing protein [Fermentimonas sp.]|nr:BON domain-containing protein [Fermentimonas sp.]
MKLLSSLSIFTLILTLGLGAVSCSNVSDADIQSVAQEALNANPDLAGVMVTVQNKVATITGTVQDDATKAYAESTVAGVENVTSVNNQIVVVPPAPDYTALDNAINAALADALKDHPKVTATVQDGVITINGELKESDLPTLMEKLNALNPQQIVNNATIK